jgi:hypothetical protein
MSDNISSVFGSGFLSSLMPINVIVEVEEDEDKSDNECVEEKICASSSELTATDVTAVLPKNSETQKSKTGERFYP